MSLTRKLIYGIICIALITIFITGCNGDEDDSTGPENESPVAVNDSYTVHTEEVLTVEAPGVLANSHSRNSHHRALLFFFSGKFSPLCCR